MQPGQQKISQFDPITSTQTGDIIPIVRNGQNKRITVENFSGVVPDGFISAAQVWTFSSWSATTNIGVITVPSDATTRYYEGQFVRITQTTGGIKYGMILTVTTTTIAVWMPGYTLVNEAIASPFTSSLAHPPGVPPRIADGNPYKFGAWRSTAGTVNGSDVTIAMTVKDYDSTNNYNTGTGLFTAPKDGTYVFMGQITFTATSTYAWGNLWKNGAMWHRANRFQSGNGAPISTQHAVFGQLELLAGDTVAIGAATGNSNPLESGDRLKNYFYGRLESRG